MIKVCLIGNTGKLGKLIESRIKKNRLIKLVGKISKSTNHSFERSILNCDVIIDVSHPDVTCDFLKRLKLSGRRCPYIIGNTGWSENQMKSLNSISKKLPILFAPNFSTSVSILDDILVKVAPKLKSLGFSAEISEIHHTKKRDAPSGTALLFARTLKKYGKTKPSIRSSRIGDVIGTHVIRFHTPSETLTFTHEAHSRKIFANGAIECVKWISKIKKPGLYDIKAVVSED